MALIQIPHDMTEFRVMVEQLKGMGKDVNEEELLQQAVLDNAQQILDEALDGHYFTCKMEDGEIVVYDVINQPTGKISPLSDSFKEDFISDADGLWIYLTTEMNKIAGGR